MFTSKSVMHYVCSKNFINVLSNVEMFKIIEEYSLIIFPGSDDDLEYYVRECGDILGVTSNLPQDSRDAKHILEYIFTHVVEFKKLNQV